MMDEKRNSFKLLKRRRTKRIDHTDMRRNNYMVKLTKEKILFENNETCERGLRNSRLPEDSNGQETLNV